MAIITFMGPAACIDGVTYRIVKERRVQTFTPVGELSDLKLQFFVQTGDCRQGRIGAWIMKDPSGRAVFADGVGEPEILGWWD